MTYLLILGGLVLLAIGGEAVVRGAVGAARKLGVSELLIGLTLIGFGTSAPELLTSVNAALRGSTGVALGNVVGSNISNILFIFAIAALIRPVMVDPRALRRDGLFMVLVSFGTAALAIWLGGYDRVSGAAMLTLLLVYIGAAFFLERRSNSLSAELHRDGAEAYRGPGLLASLALSAVGLAALVFGADLLVRGAVDLARQAGLSETVIGLTVVAVGTSLPELVATLAAAARGRADIAFGNIVGSNIYNMLGILGVTAIIQPIATPPDLGLVDWGVFVGGAVLLVLHAWTGAKVSRWEGALMLGVFLSYVAYLILRVGGASLPQ